MDLQLAGKVAVVSGGTTGIGAAAALEFAREGCAVVVCGRSAEKLRQFEEAMEEAGVTEYLALQSDATDKAQVERFADAVCERFGGIDIWVNCAGGNRHGPLDALSEEDYRYILDLNLTSVFYGLQAAAARMKPRGGGAIINVSSQSSITPVAYRVLYGAAKAAVNMLTRGAAAELAPSHIRVNAVAPGVTDTALMKKAIYEQAEYTMSRIPMHRAADPAEVGALIVCLASGRLGYANGTVISINGGQGAVEDTEIPWTQPWNP